MRYRLSLHQNPHSIQINHQTYIAAVAVMAASCGTSVVKAMHGSLLLSYNVSCPMVRFHHLNDNILRTNCWYSSLEHSAWTTNWFLRTTAVYLTSHQLVILWDIIFCMCLYSTLLFLVQGSGADGLADMESLSELRSNWGRMPSLPSPLTFSGIRNYDSRCICILIM